MCVLLYSKYSPMSQNLLKVLDTSPVNLSSTLGLTSLCVDNEEIRQRIINTNKIEISRVPCILNVYTNGVVEKYEGNDAAIWLDEMIKPYLPSPTPPPQPIKEKPIDDDSESSIEYIKKKKRKPVVKRKKTKKMTTNIEELSDMEEKSDEIVPISKPPVAVRNGPGGHDFSGDFADHEPTETNIRETAQQTKVNGLMSAAMEMQKERESADNNIKQRPL